MTTTTTAPKIAAAKATRPQTGPTAARAKPASLKRPAAPGASPEARRAAALILEVLAGTRTSVAAARALEVSLPRYYVLEGRAVQAMVSACEPRRRGRQRTAEREVDRLQRENARLVRERDRGLALLRSTQRTIGLAPPPKPEPGKAGGKRRRRPVARGLRAAKTLAATSAATSATTVTSTEQSSG